MQISDKIINKREIIINKINQISIKEDIQMIQ